MATAAEDLNAKWDTLSSTLNTYPQLDKKTTSVLNAAIAQWQDWFYNDENYGKWGDTHTWLDKYNSAAKLLKKAIKGKKAKAPVVTTPKTAVRVMPPLLVTAKPPINWKLYLTIGAVVLVIGGIIYYNHKHPSKSDD